MRKIELYGKSKSIGTYDDFFDNKKYKSYKQAKTKKDIVVADFMKSNNGDIFVRIQHINHIDVPKFYRLEYQNCFCGLDVIDDNNIYNIAIKMLKI